MNTNIDHIWFTEQLATYLAEGLEGDERAQFEAHAAECEDCRAQLEEARRVESRLSQLFADATPTAGFEDRIISRLREKPNRRIWIHPFVMKAAATAAAVTLVGTVGYVANQQLTGKPRVATSAVDASRDGWQAATGNNHDEDRQNELVGRGHVEFQSNPFSGVQRDNIFARQAAPSGSLIDLNDSVLLPTENNLGSRMEIREQVVNGPVAGGYLRFDQNDFAGKKLEGAETLGRELKELDRFRPNEQPAGGVPGAMVDKLQAAQKDQVVLGQPLQAAKPATPALQTAAGGEVVQQQATDPAPVVNQRKVIRNGEIEFEVDSFDSAFMTVSKVVVEEGGFIATTSSQKLDNGKVKGAVVVRVPPDRLDTLVLKLRALGELKRQNLTAQDVSKQYSDLESEMRGARAMEERLIEMIKSGKGEIKDLLAAEKELAVWRGKLEKIQGEINYYNNLISLSTLKIDLTEKNIATAAAATQQENVNIGVETDEVEKARADAIKAIDDAKGRIIESEMKKLDAGQLAAKIVAEVPQDAAGPVIDRLKQLGKVARLDIERKQTTPGGETPAPGARVEEKPTRLIVSLYNLANVAPRQTTNLNLASDDVETVYHRIIARVDEAGGRVVSSNLNRAKADQISGTIQFEIKSSDAATVLNDVRGSGEVMRMDMVENPDTANVTGAKRGFVVQLYSVSQIAPRETSSVQLAASDVVETHRLLAEAARVAGARVLASQVNQQDRSNVSGVLDVEVKRDKLADFDKALVAAGDVMARNVTRSADLDNTIDSKVRLQISLAGADRVPPRQTNVLAVEVRDVEGTAAKIASSTAGVGGRVIDSNLSKEASGRTIARVILDLPLAQADRIVEQIKASGGVRVEREATSAQIPEGKLSRARVEATFATPDAIVAADQGLWGSIREGLSTSAAGLLWSLRILVVGLCFVVPWAAILWGGWKVTRRARGATRAT
jgi:glycine cleavage system regulatory protein